MALDIYIARLSVHSYAMSTVDAVEILADIRRGQQTFQANVSASGIPEMLANLLAATKKSESEKVAKNLTIQENDLFRLINNCTQLGFTCLSRFPEFVPEHLNITEDDRKNITTGTLRKVSSKLSSLFVFRKNVHVHLFERASEWHYFYFSYNDIESDAENHWKHGPHIHYISHLWPNIDADRVWSAFNKRRTRISGSLHIRFIPFDFSDSDILSDHQHDAAFQTLFPADPLILDEKYPTPPAQIATRGAWIANISIHS